MAGTATWQITGTSDDGTQVIINVTATLNDDGSITVKYDLADESADADIIGVYFDFFNDGGDLDTAGNGRGGSANNMKGYGDGFDAAFEEGKAGLEDGANTEGTITFTAEQLIEFGFGEFFGTAENGDPVIDGAGLMEAFAETEIGIRATSTGDDGEGSLKIGAVGEYHPGGDGNGDDWFPDFKDFTGKDISNVVVYFNIAGDGEDCVVYTVKIDEWKDVLGTQGNDLDDSWEAILAYIIANDDNITAETPVLGAAIFGGGEELFFGVGEFDEGLRDEDGNNLDDDLPCDLDAFITSNDLNEEYDATDVFAAA